jgi:DNA-directed RNA polymerase specialized sigma24 family protein
MTYQGQHSGFENYVLSHWGDLYRLAVGIGYNRASAERLVHVTLVAGFDQLNENRLQSPADAKLWLLKLMIRFPGEALCDEVDDLKPSRSAEPGFQPDADPLLVGVHLGLQQLGGQQRIILLLAILERRSCEDIADILKLSESEVRRELARCVLQFHKSLAGSSPDFPMAVKEASPLGR